jgi:peptidoglycan hydrolase CwlO-like protein
MSPATSSNYLMGDLLDRIKYLHTALNQAEQIINSLETENQRLKDALNNLVSKNNEDYTCKSEMVNESTMLTV